MLEPLGHQQLFLFFLQFAALLASARICGELAKRIRTPAVVGELFGGLLLGPSLLGAVAPGLQSALFPHDQLQNDLLSLVTWLGVIFLLLSTGLETDLALIRRKGRKAVSVSAGGITITFLSGLILAAVLPAELRGESAKPIAFMLFIATAMSISAIPVIARVLSELGLIRRDVGQLILAAGMMDDTVGWILLAVVANVASPDPLNWFTPIRLLVSVGLVVGLALTVGRSFVAALIRWVDDKVPDYEGVISATATLTLIGSAITLVLGLEAVLGAFLIGILIREAPRYRPEMTHGIEQFTRLILAPVFFAAAGLKVDITVFADWDLLKWGLLVLAVATVGKFVGTFIGSRIAKMPAIEGLAMGAGLNARGAMEIIVATIGLSLGVLSTSSYSIIVMVAIITSLMAPPMLRLLLSRVKMGAEEEERLEREARERESFWAGIRRVILPTRGGGNVYYAASLLREGMQGTKIEVTTLNIDDRQERIPFWRRRKGDDVGETAVATAATLLQPLASQVKKVRLKSRNVSKIIAEQAAQFDLIVLGATAERANWRTQYTFGQVVDEVLQRSQRPVLVVRSPVASRIQVELSEAKLPVTKILVPTNRTSLSRPALEFGERLGASTGATCHAVFIEEEPGLPPNQLFPLYSYISPGPEDMAEKQGSNLEELAFRARRSGEAIAQLSQERGYDLIVMSAQLRPGTRRAYLGPQVETILQLATCPVAVLVQH